MSRNSFKVLIILFLTGVQIITSSDNPREYPCQIRNYGNGNSVCVCNSTYCDFIQPVEKLDYPNFVVYTSNNAGLRFSKTYGQFEAKDNSTSNVMHITDQGYQKMYGFGGAFTDATGINIKSLSIGAQENLLRSYFGKDGIDYTLGRVPIGCTDFSTHPYTYDDTFFEDPKLTNFRLAKEDHKYKIPILQEAMRLSENKLNLIAVAWTSPKWMKIFPMYAIMFGQLKGRMFQPWADYHVKFLEEYEKHNITFWGISTGNEPSVGYTPLQIPTVAFTASLLSKWVSNNFGPTIRNSKYSDIKILTLDDERIFLPWFIEKLLQNPITENYIDGIGVHYYSDFIAPEFLLDITHEKFPNKFIMTTEACRGFMPLEKKVDLGSWQRGEDIAYGIIQNVKHWSSGWIDWNLALNEYGGPSYISNHVDSPIIVNAKADEFYKQPMFYVLGHFSKFVPPGSVRIDVTKSNSRIRTIGFKRPDGGIVVILVNTTNEQVDVRLIDKVKGKIYLRLTSRSITSVVFW